MYTDVWQQKMAMIAKRSFKLHVILTYIWKIISVICSCQKFRFNFSNEIYNCHSELTLLRSNEPVFLYKNRQRCVSSDNNFVGFTSIWNMKHPCSRCCLIPRTNIFLRFYQNCKQHKWRSNNKTFWIGFWENAQTL